MFADEHQVLLGKYTQVALRRLEGHKDRSDPRSRTLFNLILGGESGKVRQRNHRGASELQQFGGQVERDQVAKELLP